jgi:hypothetical protein
MITSSKMPDLMTPGLGGMSMGMTSVHSKSTGKNTHKGALAKKHMSKYASRNKMMKATSQLDPKYATSSKVSLKYGG